MEAIIVKKKKKLVQASELQQMDVARLVLFTVLTGGLYHGIWYIKRLTVLNSLESPIKLFQGAFGFMIAGCLANIAILLAVTFGQESIAEHTLVFLNEISGILNMAVWLVILMQAFKVRKIFIDHFSELLKRDITVSWFWTFVFTTFYLQYKINRLQEQEKESLIGNEG